jgi:hypothetical protein
MPLLYFSRHFYAFAIFFALMPLSAMRSAYFLSALPLAGCRLSLARHFADCRHDAFRLFSYFHAAAAAISIIFAAFREPEPDAAITFQ